MTNVSAISLFSGCGGSDLGLRAAGVEVIWANEINESACAFYEAVTGSKVIEHADVRTIDKFKKADLLVGCYPCQGYSQGGLRKADSSINYLYREFDRALRQIKPLAFIVENVDGMRFKQNSDLFRNQLVRFRLAGYRIAWKVLNASEYGVAQSRKRVFIVGIRSGENMVYDFPKPTHGPDTSRRYKTQKDAIWKFRDQIEGTYNTEPFHWYYLSRNRRRPWDEPAATIVARDRHISLHPDSPPLERIHTDKWVFKKSQRKPRRLSYLECAALQGFSAPKKFSSQSLSLRYRAIGNAVPPPLFAAVTKKLLNQLNLA